QTNFNHWLSSSILPIKCRTYYLTFGSDQVVHKILENGNIAASIDRTHAAADNKDTYRNSGLYGFLPQAEFGACSA
ncbi:MAG: hypothetical protein QGH37_26795, partial [Candidatus Poribacteria bacterium]|nr:hypothetical protein [Candidatus Poribacteria bacterium]